MKSPLLDITCASLPCPALAALADIRCAPGVQVAITNERVWVRWQPGDDTVLRRVLPIAGAVLYFQREGKWYRFGHHLPAFEVPARLEYQPLYRVLTPERFLAEPVPAVRLQPVKIGLAADSRSRKTSALLCTLTGM